MFDPTAPFDERRTVDVFERDLLPFLQKHGPLIGELAMQGDGLCEEIVRRYHLFSIWKDPHNLSLLTEDLRNYEQRKSNE